MKYGCVILADVHHPLLEATRCLLEAMFETVVMVSSYESLLEAAGRMNPELIVADISLPSSDGTKFLLKLDEQLSKFKLIVLGTYSDTEIIDNILKKGAEAYVLKHSTASDLPKAVDKVLRGETYVSTLNVT